MTQNNWQWVAFLFDGADELFLKSNPLFVKRSGNGNSSTEEFDDWWEFFDEAQNSPRFFLLVIKGHGSPVMLPMALNVPSSARGCRSRPMNCSVHWRVLLISFRCGYCMLRLLSNQCGVWRVKSGVLFLFLSPLRSAFI